MTTETVTTRRMHSKHIWGKIQTLLLF